MKPDTTATDNENAAHREGRKRKSPPAPDSPGVARVKLLLARLSVQRHGFRLPKRPVRGSAKETQDVGM